MYREFKAKGKGIRFIINSWFNFHLIFIRVYEEHTIEESSKSAKSKGKVNRGKHNFIITLVTRYIQEEYNVIITLIVIDDDTQDNIR